MSRWLTYLKERFPLPVYVLLVGGIVLSGLYLESGRFDLRAFLLAFIGIMLFFSELRLMDELKDYKKDLEAHPERPLPRGLLTPEEVRKAIGIKAVVMLAYGGLVAFLANPFAGACYGILTVYLWLMYREFFVGSWLEKRAIWYAVSHQIIMIPLAAFCVLVFRPAMLYDTMTLYMGLCMLGSFFSYEVCRKLDPKAHPVLKTYLYMYGPKGTAVLVLCASAVAAFGAYRLGLEMLLWPMETLLLISLILLFAKPDKFKIIEGVASLSLLVHLWAIVIQHFAGWPSG
jgi:4-hydroxybenzoate polyprenyltransferase